MKKIIGLLLAATCSLLMVSGQTTGRLPWVNGKLPKAQNGFEYMIANSYAATLSEAQKIARSEFLAKITSQAGVEVSSDVTVKTSNQSEVKNDISSLAESIDFQKTSVIKGKKLNIAFVQVSEYHEYENGQYQLWELYEVSTGSESFKPYIPEYTDQYGISAAWRSIIIPGWGQFYKGKTGKGFFFLAAEVAAVSGVIYCDMKRSDNMRLSQETTNMSIVKEYRDRADNWALYRNAAIGAAAGIYIWNVLDAALSKGKIHYAWIPDNMHLNGSESMGNYYYGLAFNF